MLLDSELIDVGREYDPAVFWEERLAKDFSLRRVGHEELGNAFNYWLYQARFLAVRRLIRKRGIVTSGKRLLDIGTGIGMWIPFWKKLGIGDITGLDVSSGAVSFLRRSFPGGRFLQADVRNGLPLSGKFDIVTAFDILYHILEEDGFTNAIDGISELLGRDSWVFVIDSFGGQPWGPTYHECHRSIVQYEDVLAAHGLEIVDVLPVFYLMATPICSTDVSHGRELTTVVRLVQKGAKSLAVRGLERLNYVLGAVLFGVDASLTSIARVGPSLKVAVLKRSGD